MATEKLKPAVEHNILDIDPDMRKTIIKVATAVAMLCIVIGTFLGADIRDAVCDCENETVYICPDGTEVLNPKHCPKPSSTTTSTLPLATTTMPPAEKTTTTLAATTTTKDSECETVYSGGYCDGLVAITCVKGIKTDEKDCTTVRKPIWDDSGDKPVWYTILVPGECRTNSVGAFCYEKGI